MLPDSCFERGTFYHIVPGNKGRLLDGRRTPGMIEKYDSESAMFIWRITGFEDKGRYWVIPADKIGSYQFEKNSIKLTERKAQEIKSKCEQFDEKLIIEDLESELSNTLKLIDKEKKEIKDWFLKQSQFVRLGNSFLDIEAKIGSEFLFKDLNFYMDLCGILDLEEKTANQYVLNPYSGEWIKGLRIVMAEMGLLDFNEKKPRTKDIFKGIGSRDNRKKYIITRLAFVQTFFELAGYEKIQLFRGMTTEKGNFETSKTLVSASFNPEVGKAFSNIDRNEKVTFSYVIKFTYSIKNLFMTFFETAAFNERYQEQEAVILYRNKLLF